MADPLCKIEQGQLRGSQDKDYKGGKFLSFLGIPFAKPPVGELRFKDPQPPEKWEGIRDATKEGSPCLSEQVLPDPKGGMAKIIAGSEDCLFLNVFTKKLFTDDKKLKPVIVFIPGGAFVTGSASRIMYGPEFLLTEDIVLVTIQYRLGALGFLAFDDPSFGISGNAGLKDQAQALKWVKNNIKAFGGNPDNVTLAGVSAGSASVHYQILSPLTKGLFHKAILQSGTALDPWTQATNDSRELAKVLGYNESKDENILKFLQKAPGPEIVEGQLKMKDLLGLTENRKFGPKVEPTSKNAFISKPPEILVQKLEYNKVPMLIGYSCEEGAFLKGTIATSSPFDTTNLVPWYLGLKGSEHAEVNEKITKFYSKDVPIADNEQAINDVLTDIMFLRGIYVTIRNHVKTQKPVYFYRNSLVAGLNIGKAMFGLTCSGASHGDELGYLFKTPLPFKTGSPEEVYVKRFVRLWTNFARTGEPTPSHDPLLDVIWKPATEGEMNYLEIGTELVPGTDPDIAKMKFWDEIIHPITKYN